MGQLSLADGLTVIGDEENLIIAVNEPTVQAEEEEIEVSVEGESVETETADSSDNNEDQSE